MSDVAVSYPAGASPYLDGPAGAAPGKSVLWKGDSFSFHDLLDVINPIQHIPVVGTVYRWLSGDTIGNAARVMGDTLFGGPIGAVTGMIGALLKEGTGKDVGEHVIAMFDSPPATDASAALVGDDRKREGARPAIQVAYESPALAKTVAALSPGLPLNRGTPASAGNLTRTDAEQAFVTQNAKLMGGRSAASTPMNQLPPRPIINTPVPLQLTGAPLPERRPLFSPVQPAHAQGQTPPGQAQPALKMPNQPAAGTFTPVTIPAPGDQSAAGQMNPPIEVSQKMMEALDRYMRIQQDRDRTKPTGAGAQLDVRS